MLGTVVFFSSLPSSDNITGSIYYNGPSHSLKRVVGATAFQGSYGPLPNLASASRVSARYSVRFPAPAIECGLISQNIMEGFKPAMGCDPLNITTDDIYGENAICQDPNEYDYLACVPDSSSLVPFPPNSMSVVDGRAVWVNAYPVTNETFNARMGNTEINYIESLEGKVQADALGAYQDAFQLFIAMVNHSASDGVSEYGGNGPNWDVINCTLFNATYTVDITDVAGEGQTVAIASTVHERVTSSAWAYNVSGLNSISTGVADAIDEDPYQYMTAQTKSSFSYLAMMECLGILLVGEIYQGQSLDTLVLETELAYSQEPFSSLGNFTYDVTRNSTNTKLAPMIEQLFENMTLALYSRPDFLHNTTSPSNITVVYSVNVYSYASRRLWIAYGVDIGIALVIMIAGCAGIWHNQASYSSKFSTYLRTTRGSKFDAIVEPGDRKGTDPLPARIGNAKNPCRSGESPLGHKVFGCF
jgi:hypothetical protein